MTARTRLAAAAMTLGLASLTFAAPAVAAKTPDATRNCFPARQWQDWRGSDPKTILVRVFNHDVWRIDLEDGSNLVTDDTSHLISHLVDSDWVCGPSDLSQLEISNSGVTLPLFVKAITKLTPDQIAAIRPKDRP